MALVSDFFRRMHHQGHSGLRYQFCRQWQEGRVYRQWLKQHGILSDDEINRIRQEIDHFARNPLISIALPVYNTPEIWLREAIESVRNQLYPHWQLCIADDASTAPHIHPLLEKFSDDDERIHVTFREKNHNISACSNSALALTTGTFTTLLDHDDRLAPEALFYIVKAINAHPSASLIYSDEDRLSVKGKRCRPNRKPGWNPDLLLGQHYINHLSVYRTDLLRSVGGFRTGFEGSQDYDLALRATHLLTEEQIIHIPRILYHWRMATDSVSRTKDSAAQAQDASKRALQNHLNRISPTARLSNIPPHGFHRIHWPFPNPIPDIERISFSPNAPSLAEAIEKAQKSTAPLICFLDASLKPEPGWKEELTSHALRKDIAAAGGVIFSPTGRISDGAYCNANPSTPLYKNIAKGDPGPHGRAGLAQNVPALSLRCLMLRREVFKKLVIPDEFASLPLAQASLQFSVLLHPHGRLLWTPFAAFQ